MKHWTKSKTIAFNAIRAMIDGGVVVMLMGVDWETAGASPQVAVWIMLGLSMFDKVANMYLRTITSTAVRL